MLTSCIIIEDQPPAQRILKKYIQDIGTLELKGIFSSAIEALPYLQEYEVDLIFLDIHLPKLSGMDFLKTLKSSAKVILTTAFSDYAIESYEYNVVDYLLKPFSFQRFTRAVAKSETLFLDRKEKKKKGSNTFYVKSGYDLIKLNSLDILFIKSDADYTEVVIDGKKYLSSDTLKQWFNKLNDSFCQVHKSYIVNTVHIKKIKGNEIYLNDNSLVPIGRVYKETFMDTYVFNEG